MRRQQQRYSDPYLCGVALGLVLLAAIALSGRGLGASGAFNAVAAAGAATVSPELARQSALFSRYLDAPVWRDWLVLEIAGVVAGGFLSAWLAGRLDATTERGAGVTIPARLVAAFTGGAVMGAGAVLARGCTSGLALTGGALLSAGGWLFMFSAFAAAYAVAPFVRKAWR